MVYIWICMPKVPKKKVEKAIKGILEGKTQKQALLDAGYSKSSAKNPKIIRKSRTWEEILKSDFSDEFVAKKQKKLMNVKIIKNVKFPYTTPDEDIRNVFKICSGVCLYIGDEVRETAQGEFRWRTGVGYVLDVDMLNVQIDRLYKLKGQYKNADFMGTLDWNTASFEELMEQKKKLEEEDKLFMDRFKKYAPTKGLTNDEADTASEGKTPDADRKRES